MELPMRYKIILRTMTSGLPWEHEFDISSNDMAIEYTEKQLSQAHNIPLSVMGADLFCLEPEKHIASYVTKTEQRAIRQ